MSLITCPDCQRPVSQFATACPGCGRPMRMQGMAYPPGRAPIAVRAAGERQNVQIAYGLWAASYLVGPLLFAAVIFAYVRRGDARGTFMAAHYDWLIETFWHSLLGAVGGIAVVLMLMAVSEVLGAVFVIGLVLFLFGWPIYRLIKGWTALNAGRAPEAADAPW
jgi:uncharacterized membrane protein